MPERATGRPRNPTQMREVVLISIESRRINAISFNVEPGIPVTEVCRQLREELDKAGCLPK
jgi:hypothetical protein